MTKGAEAPSSIVVQSLDASNSNTTPAPVTRSLSSKLPPPTLAQEGLLKIIQHKKKRKAYTIELLLHFVFMSVFFTVLFLQRDVYSAFLMNQGIISALITQPITGVNNSQPFSKNFLQIGQWEDIRDYMIGVLGPTINQSSYYSNTPYETRDQNYVQYYNRLIGGIRLRQLRTRNDTCTIPPGFESLADYGCFEPSGDMEIRPFGPANNTSKYTYQTADKTGSSSIWGYSGGWYSGAGYVVDIPLGTDFNEVAKELIADQWWDKHTQVIIITINFLNVNFGSRVSVLYLMIELTPGGYINAVPIMKSFRVSLYTTRVDKFRAFLEVVFVCMILYYFGSELKQIIKTGMEEGSVYSYFFDVWNIVELLNVVMFSISIIMYFAYLGRKDRRDTSYMTDARYLPELEGLASVAINLYNISAFNILLTAFRTFKYLQLNDRLYMLWKALRFASADLAAFLLLFLVMFLAFIGMGILSFGADTNLFNTFGNSFGTSWNFVMGNPPDYSTLAMSNRVLGAIFFSGFAVFMFFILVSMFVAILSDAFSEVKQKNTAKPLTHALRNRVSQVVGRVKNLMRGRQLISPEKLIKRMKNPAILEQEEVTLEEMKAAIGPGTTNEQAREMMAIHDKLMSGQYDDSILADIPMGTLPRRNKDSQMSYSPTPSKLGTSSKLGASSSISAQDYDLASLRADVDVLNGKMDAILELIEAFAGKKKSA